MEAPDVPHYVAELRYFGDGMSQVVAYRSDLLPRRRHGERGPSRPRAEMREEDQVRSLARSRRELTSKVIMLRADHMLTLTYRENKTDLAECWLDVGRWERMMQNKYPGFAFVIAPERQQRGAWHFHVATRGRFDYNMVRYLWRKSIRSDLFLDQRGNIDGRPSPRGGPAWRVIALASYLAKYMIKSQAFVDSINARRYSCSKGIREPQRVRFYLPLSDSSFLQLVRVVSVASPHGVRRRFEVAGPMPVIWLSSF